MQLTTAKRLTALARKHGFAVPALNTNGGTYDITRAIIEAAAEADSPLIIQCYEPNLSYRGADYFVSLVKGLARDVNIPIAIQLDHGKSWEAARRVIQAGFTTVMLDYADLPLEENIQKTKEALEKAHAFGVPVEAEIGHILRGSEQDRVRSKTTDCQTVLRYLERVEPDLLAVALGTTHGIFERQESIDFALLKAVAAQTDVPLVLHGTCGIPTALLERCVALGIAKINFGETLRLAYFRHLEAALAEFDYQHHPWKLLQEVKDRLKPDVKRHIAACGSENRAGLYLS